MTSISRSLDTRCPWPTAGPAFDLVTFAKHHRYRLRNLHDGGPVPPAIWKDRPEGHQPGYRGSEGRWDAIVGLYGYVALDGGELVTCLFFGSAQGVNRALPKLREIGARIDQTGDVVSACEAEEVCHAARRKGKENPH